MTLMPNANISSQLPVETVSYFLSEGLDSPLNARGTSLEMRRFIDKSLDPVKDEDPGQSLSFFRSLIFQSETGTSNTKCVHRARIMTNTFVQ